MSNRIAFQTQLASIMEVLANAAVAEICKLVDDDYAVINLQMTQCQRENKALKRKLHILELKMARGLAERRIGSLSRANRVHVTAAAAALTDKYRNQNNDVAFGGQFNAGLWSDAGSDAGGEQKPLGVSNSLTGETISDIENVLIKVEAFEEAPTQQNIFMGDCGLAASPSQTVNEVGDDQVSRMQRQTLEQEPIKSEESESVAIMGDLKKWEDAQIRAIIVQDGEPNTSTSTTSPDKSAGTYGTEPIEVAVPHRRDNEGSQKNDFSALHLNIQGAIERNPPHSQQSSYHAHTESDPEQDCVLICSETVSSKTLSQEQKSKTTADGPIRMEKRRNQEQSRFSKVLHTAASSGFNPSCNSVLSQTNSYLPQPGTSSVSVEVLNHTETSRGKGFVCKYCDRGFRGMSNLMAHQRVHTGERPFKCDTCGKRFTEAGNLKKHQRVHTGEKPYVCFRCGKRFGWICNLKAHQQSASCGRN